MPKWQKKFFWNVPWIKLDEGTFFDVQGFCYFLFFRQSKAFSIFMCALRNILMSNLKSFSHQPQNKRFYRPMFLTPYLQPPADAFLALSQLLPNFSCTSFYFGKTHWLVWFVCLNVRSLSHSENDLRVFLRSSICSGASCIKSR